MIFDIHSKMVIKCIWIECVCLIRMKINYNSWAFIIYRIVTVTTVTRNCIHTGNGPGKEVQEVKSLRQQSEWLTWDQMSK